MPGSRSFFFTSSLICDPGADRFVFSADLVLPSPLLVNCPPPSPLPLCSCPSASFFSSTSTALLNSSSSISMHSLTSIGSPDLIARISRRCWTYALRCWRPSRVLFISEVSSLSFSFMSSAFRSSSPVPGLTFMLASSTLLPSTSISLSAPNNSPGGTPSTSNPLHNSSSSVNALLSFGYASVLSRWKADFSADLVCSPASSSAFCAPPFPSLYASTRCCFSSWCLACSAAAREPCLGLSADLLSLFPPLPNFPSAACSCPLASLVSVTSRRRDSLIS